MEAGIAKYRRITAGTVIRTRLITRVTAGKHTVYPGSRHRFFALGIVVEELPEQQWHCDRSRQSGTSIVKKHLVLL